MKELNLSCCPIESAAELMRENANVRRAHLKERHYFLGAYTHATVCDEDEVKLMVTFTARKDGWLNQRHIMGNDVTTRIKTTAFFFFFIKCISRFLWHGT